jgi:exoribonuclease R
MARRSIRLADPEAAGSAALTARFARVRAELNIPEAFPPEVLAAARTEARSPHEAPADLTDIPFVTVDPPGTVDLDQAMFLSRRGDGYHVDYAIADVPAFVDPHGPVAAEAMHRGQTLYAPDRRVPLHPPVLSEDAASLLPGRTRPAFVWRFDLDAAGEVVATDLVRAMVRSRRRLDYGTVQAAANSRPARLGGHGSHARPTGVTLDPTDDLTRQAVLLREVGLRRLAQEERRGGASLPLPEQEVSSDHGSFRLQFRPALPAEDWNAQLSLMTGMAAAGIMLKTGTGVLRTMPPPQEFVLARFRRQAAALGVPWEHGVSYGDFIRGLDRQRPAQLALLYEAATLFRGAGYKTFDGEAPEQAEHAAVAAPYAHVTAPLRRLVDRFGLTVCHAATSGQQIPDWVREALPELGRRMATSDQLAGSLERRCVDLVESAVLAGRADEEFDAVTVERSRDHSVIQVQDPAVLALCDGLLPLGRRVRVRLATVDPDAARVRFVPAEGPPSGA